MKAVKLMMMLCSALISLTSCTSNEDETIINTLEEGNDISTENGHFDYTIGEGPFVYFEDVNFKNILLNNFDINLNKDDEISFEEALAFKSFIDVFDKGITSLIGIERFKNITGLNCARNQILSFNLDNNIKLEFLKCGVNPLSEINLEKNKALKRLDVRTTNITDLDLSSNINLERIIGICNYSLKTVSIKNGNNNAINIFSFKSNNPVLVCVKVDDVNLAELKNNWSKPNHCIYSFDCRNSI